MVWFVLTNGEIRTLTYEPSENVLAWSRIATTGHADQVVIIPGSPEDQVIILIDRPTATPGTTIQCIERLASTQSAIGGNVNLQVDSYVHQQSQTATTTLSGLTHLEGQQIVVWADGEPVLDLADTNTDPYKRLFLTVSGGSVTVPSAYEANNLIGGLPYTGQWQSVKLAYGSARGTALLQRKRISHLGLYLTDTALGGVRIGANASNLTGLRRDYRGRFLGRGEVLSEYDYDASQFNGGWDTDARVFIEAVAPFPATVGALAMSINTKDLDG